MNFANISAIFSTISQLPTAALIAVTCVLGGIGIGIGTAFRDIPKYSYKTICVIIDFILVLTGNKPICFSLGFEKENSNEKNKFKIIEGWKTEKKEYRHKDGHAN